MVLHFDFPQEVVDAFTEGDCWYLALSLHRQMGWDLVALGYQDDAHRSPTDRNWFHIVTRTPWGTLVDVLGEHTVAEKLARWNSFVDGQGDVFRVSTMAELFKGWAQVGHEEEARVYRSAV